MLPESFVPIVMFICVVAVIKIVSDNKTKRIIIEKGKIDENARLLFQNMRDKRGTSALKWGLVLVGIGLAVFIGMLVPYHLTREITVAAMFILAGAGLLIFYFITPKVNKDGDTAGSQSKDNDNAPE